MRLAIISHSLYVAGGQAVALSILQAVFDCFDEKKDQLMVVMPDTPQYRALGVPDYVKAVYLPVRKSVVARYFTDEILLPRLVNRWCADAVFALGNFGLKHIASVQAVLFHNAHWVYPETQIRQPVIARLRHHLIEMQLRRTLPTTDVVYCQTRTMMKRFGRTFGFEKKIEWLPNAVSTQCLEGVGCPEFFRTLQRALPGNGTTLLCLTRYYPHKNVEILLETFKIYRQELREVNVILTLDKRDGPAAARFLEQIEQAGLSRQLINIGPVSQENLGLLYAGVDGVLLPTLLESFSGTYAEAMQFGKTILTSDRDFAREVCGPAALYFDPLSTASLFGTLQHFRRDPTARKRGAVFGSGQLAQCTRPWRQSVASVLADLRELVERRADAVMASRPVAEPHQ